MTATTLRHRSLKTSAIALGLAMAMSAPAAAADLVISNWDGYMAPDVMAAFKAATGVSGEVVVHATNEEIMGKLVASGGKGYDVVFVSSPFAEVLNNLGLIETIDHAKIPNLANLYPEAAKLPHDVGNNFSVPYTWGTTGLCYRSDLVKTEPASWNDLLAPSEALKGKTTMLATDRWLLAAGQLAKGYSVNETDPAKLAEVKDLLISAKKTLLAYDDTTFYSKLVSGEALMVQAWDGWCNYGIAENPQIKYTIPKEGSDLWVDTMVVMKASANKDAAFQFINFMLDAKNHAWAAQNIDYKVPNKPAMESLPADFLAKFPNMNMPVAELVKFEQLRDVGDAQRDYSKIVSEIKAAQ
ncbi:MULTISPECIES: polyamine ABC transporter substrate-binding protein [unclassified Mesorhizobium]|uniref:polyamine ABC transporter substrate-binding protein n=1 Tax=unclassified Mesorhizobium TaxID=325217 RepID=UPI0003CFDF23|nr:MULTISPECIES: spermidine/putrescine ABC transporter substrate-binding protein [unclassified Mesorhizobium]ESZ18135.1 spermidine/putrescine ABC transporter substrate-binding protein [Mesorhizobium sp. L48C026A00]RWO24312.1 MAG: spermidine/putrescine ABC transporter substrate-binding protein [Mesorhizobium sp.]